MKVRIIIAAIIAVGIHAILIFPNFHIGSRNIEMVPSTNVIQMTLASPKKKSSERKTKEIHVNTKVPDDQKNSSQTQTNEDKNSKPSDGNESITVIHKAEPLNFSNPPPDYPRIARLRGYQGTVILNVLVQKDGTVSQIKINKSSGYWMLDQAALLAVKDWMFKPGTSDAGPVDMWVIQPIRFQLK